MVSLFLKAPLEKAPVLLSKSLNESGNVTI
jgi:hypothetical protein